jgi:TP901-1 family phage major tail protein
LAAQKGKKVLLALDLTGGSPEDWTTVAGLRTTTWTINGEDVDVTTKDDDGWQQRLAGAGVRSITISASGVFQDTAVELEVLTRSINQTLDLYRLTFENGDQLTSKFQIANYERTGDHDGAEMYTMTMNSHGTPSYTPA